jgi:phage FluMu protein Com
MDPRPNTGREQPQPQLHLQLQPQPTQPEVAENGTVLSADAPAIDAPDVNINHYQNSTTAASAIEQLLPQFPLVVASTTPIAAGFEPPMLYPLLTSPLYTTPAPAVVSQTPPPFNTPSYSLASQQAALAQMILQSAAAGVSSGQIPAALTQGSLGQQPSETPPPFNTPFPSFDSQQAALAQMILQSAGAGVSPGQIPVALTQAAFGQPLAFFTGSAPTGVPAAPYVMASSLHGSAPTSVASFAPPPEAIAACCGTTSSSSRSPHYVMASSLHGSVPTAAAASFPPPPAAIAARFGTTSSSSRSPHTPARCSNLYLVHDEENLSPYQCLARKQIDIFEATETDIQSSAQGRNRAIILRQVGIRCRHCGKLPSKQRAKGAMFFPSQMVGLYQTAQNLANTHLVKDCFDIPKAIREDLIRVRQKEKGSNTRKSAYGGGRHYWASCLRVMGVVETPDRRLEFSG